MHDLPELNAIDESQYERKSSEGDFSFNPGLAT